jgi:tetratricopeptide (TPR) repeat protein
MFVRLAVCPQVVAYSLVRALIFCGLLFAVSLSPAMAQTRETTLSSNRTPEQLEKDAVTYEQFLREPPPGTAPSSVTEARAHLGTVYFLLHRYGDSLVVLEHFPLTDSSASANSAQRSSPKNNTSTSLRAQVWLVRGLDYLELNQLPKALSALERATQLQPNNATSRLALGDTLARSNRLEDAVHEYELQTRLTPSLPDAWYKLALAHSFIVTTAPAGVQESLKGTVLRQLEAEQLLNEGRYLDAVHALFRLVHDAPQAPGIHADLGRGLLEIGYPKAAENELRKELAIDPSNPSARLDLAQTAALRGDWKEVGEQLTTVSGQQPRELTRLLERQPAGLVEQAWTQGNMHIPDEFAGTSAGGLWRAWMDQSQLIDVKGGASSAPEACRSISPAVLAPGVWLSETCYRQLEERLKANKSLSSEEKIKLAETEFRLGHYSEALQTAHSIVAAHHESEWGTYWFRNAHRGLAEECFLKVGDLDANSVRAHQMLAQAYSTWMEFAKAKKEYQAAITLAPAQPDLHMGLGNVYWRTNDWPAAEKELKTALELAPESALARYELGDTYVQQGQWQQAYDQLKSIPPDAPVIYSSTLDLAKAEDNLGKTPEAIASLVSVETRDPDGQAHFLLAGLYLKSGEKSKAQEALQTFKRLRASSLEAGKDEAGALEQEQSPNWN